MMAQVSSLLSYALFICLWLYAELLEYRKR